jgi:hypothetical protein
MLVRNFAEMHCNLLGPCPRVLGKLSRLHLLVVDILRQEPVYEFVSDQQAMATSWAISTLCQSRELSAVACRNISRLRHFS